MGLKYPELVRLAEKQRFLVTRSQILDLGIDQKAIEHELDVGRWVQLHVGVYQVRSPASRLGIATSRGSICMWTGNGLLPSCRPQALGSRRHDERPGGDQHAIRKPWIPGGRPRP